MRAFARSAVLFLAISRLAFANNNGPECSQGSSLDQLIVPDHAHGECCDGVWEWSKSSQWQQWNLEQDQHDGGAPLTLTTCSECDEGYRKRINRCVPIGCPVPEPSPAPSSTSSALLPA